MKSLVTFFARRALQWVALAFFASGVSAQTPPTASSRSAQAPAQKNVAAYTLMRTDQLSINIFQEDDLNVITRVDANGRVNLKLLTEEVRVQGMTVAEAQRAIENAYQEGRFLRNPQVTIAIMEYAPRAVTVYGMVKLPGRVILPTESTMDILELIGKVGGFQDTAKGNAVTVTRINNDGTRSVIGPIDVESLIKGKGKEKRREDVLIMMPEDIVNVPMRMF